MCPLCHRTFIVAVGLLEQVDEGLFHVVLRCNNCETLAFATLEDADLEALEQLELDGMVSLTLALEQLVAVDARRRR